jgi:hypothetical protein
LIIEEPELPPDVAKALDVFIERPSDEELRHVQEAVARAGMWGTGPELFVYIVAHLAADRRVALADAARTLAALPQLERRGLSPAASHLVEVADAVVEDSGEGLMEVDDDELFRDGVQRVLSATARTR